MTNISTLGQALDQIERLKEIQSRFSTLSTQLATGKKTQNFTGLGTDVLTSERSRTNFKTLDAYVSNIINADRRIQLTLTTIEQFKAQAENFAAALVSFSQQSTHQEGDIIYFDDPATTVNENTQIGMTSSESDVDFQSLQQLAGSLYDVFIDLVNEKDGDRFVLAGAETKIQPLVDSGTLDTAITSLLGDWKTTGITTDELISGLQSRDASVDPNAVTDTIIGYSAPLSSGSVKNIYVRVDDNTEIDYTALANESAFRDIIVAAAYIKNENLPPIADELDPATLAVLTEGAPGTTLQEMKDNFYNVFNNMTTLVNNAIDRIDQARFKLESARARITEIKHSHEDAQNLLLGTIADVEDVDINEVAVKITSLQIQLEASFRVTALLQDLSLVNFI